MRLPVSRGAPRASRRDYVTTRVRSCGESSAIQVRPLRRGRCRVLPVAQGSGTVPPCSLLGLILIALGALAIVAAVFTAELVDGKIEYLGVRTSAPWRCSSSAWAPASPSCGASRSSSGAPSAAGPDARSTRRWRSCPRSWTRVEARATPRHRRPRRRGPPDRLTLARSGTEPGPARARATRSPRLTEPARSGHGHLDRHLATARPSHARSRAPLAVASLAAAAAGPSRARRATASAPASAARSAADWAVRCARDHRTDHAQRGADEHQDPEERRPPAPWLRRAGRADAHGGHAVDSSSAATASAWTRRGRAGARTARPGPRDLAGDGDPDLAAPLRVTVTVLPGGATRSPRRHGLLRGVATGDGPGGLACGVDGAHLGGADGQQPDQADGDGDQQRQDQRQLGGDRTALAPCAGRAALIRCRAAPSTWSNSVLSSRSPNPPVSSV